VEGSFGAFAGLFALDDERLLAATTDGVGTKLILSRRAGRLFDAGADLAAHCANDLLTVGAAPLFFLDYAAAASLDLAEVAELVAGAASVCREAGCAILGGETAERPDIYREDQLDFAGTMVGLVRREDLVDGSRCEPGDAVLGLPSSGLHANGFTLVRRLLGDGDFDADLLLTPTRLYLHDVRSLRASCDVRALAHVTGGGIPANLPRALPAGLGARLDPGSWGRPPVYAWLDARGVPEDEQRRVFNLGVGLCAVVPAAEAGRTGLPVIGRLEEGLDGVAWADGP
jgi:phosphoribosylformylglycinamidine cyclo-ligase